MKVVPVVNLLDNEPLALPKEKKRSKKDKKEKKEKKDKKDKAGNFLPLVNFYKY